MTEAPVKRVFKVSAGQRNRDLVSQFVAGSYAAIGPGSTGDWRNGKNHGKSVATADASALNCLVAMVPGDLVLLTVGYEAKALGRVVEKYEFTRDGQLYGGWDLYHSIRVKFACLDQLEIRDRDRYSPWPRDLKVRRRLCALGGGSAEHIKWANELDQLLEQDDFWSTVQVPDLALDDPEIVIDKMDGFSRFSAARQEMIRRAFDDVREVREAIEARGWSPEPSEHEAVALMVVPVLRAFGWQPTQIALEWNWVDVALFDAEDTGRERPLLLLEAKRPGMGLDWAKGQAGKYAEKHQTDCPVVTTDGFCWTVFKNAECEPLDASSITVHDPRRSSQNFFEVLTSLGVILT